MEVRPILSAMRRNKVGAILIAAQMAITLAILCNALFIIEQRIALSNRPSGADERNVFVITNQWVGKPSDLAARLQADLAALRALSGVIDASVSNAYVLGESGSSSGITLKPDQRNSSAQIAVYFGDDHAMQSLGLKLVAGRNFTADEISDKMGYNDTAQSAGVLITRALAERLFPEKAATGQTIVLPPDRHSIPVVGIVDRLQVPWVEPWSRHFSDYSIILPFRFLSPQEVHYIVRVRPGQLAAVLKAAQAKLFDVNRRRVLENNWSLTDARAAAYKDDHGLAIILAVVCTALVAVTAFGIVGLTSYWVAQRRRQIGIRRALGATRRDIVQYFQTENLLIAVTGAAIGILLAVSANLWMVSAFAMQRLQTGYAFVGALIVLLLGQAAVFWPATKAGSIPPALVMRGS
jgi:putative ABC transport system permease protein